MSTGLRVNRVGYALLLSVAILCAGVRTASGASSSQRHAKPKEKKQLQVLPSGPTGPVQAMPLDAIAAVPPQVTYQDNQLTIVAPNSTLADILRAVRKQTGAEIEIPAAPERVVTHLGPGPARSVVADLLNGSRFNYVLLGSPQDDAVLTRVVLVAKGAVENTNTAAPAMAQQVSPANPVPPPGQDAPQSDANEGETAEDNSSAEENPDQAAAEAEQPANNPDQPGVKTPQQMLQEMQQRQMQLQQQQPQGQAPVPGSGMPPHPPQEQ